jgi:hypothetical protein
MPLMVEIVKRSMNPEAFRQFEMVRRSAEQIEPMVGFGGPWLIDSMSQIDPGV